MKISLASVMREDVYHTFFPLAALIKKEVEAVGHEFDNYHIPSTTLLEHMRSAVISKVLEDGADVVLLYDDDVTFDPEAVLTLIEPFERGWAQPPCGMTTIPVAMRGRGINVAFKSQHVGFKLGGGWHEVDRSGFGVVAISAVALRKVAERLPRVSILDNIEGWPFCRSAFFREANGKLSWRGEDYTFSRRLQNAGFKIWANTTLRATHHVRGERDIEDVLFPVNKNDPAPFLPPHAKPEEDLAVMISSDDESSLQLIEASEAGLV